MKGYIPLSVPNLTGNELKYVTEALETEWVSTGGPLIEQFEEDFTHYLSINHAVACQSGTASIHLALIALGIKKGQEVIVPTLTFIAAINPVTYVGANPVFMDCDSTLCMDLDKLEEFCKNKCEIRNGRLIHRKNGCWVKAVIVVHVFGNMPNMERLMQIAERYCLIVIEDATEAIGTKCISGHYAGRFAGTIGAVGCLSFNGNKIITTGGGGMLITNIKEVADKARYLSTQAKDNSMSFIHDEIGYNYRMTNLQAALGCAQLEQLDKFLSIKMDNYLRYQQSFQTFEHGEILPFTDGIRPNYWFYSLLVQDPTDKDKMINWLSQHGIQARPIWKLNHEQKPYKESYAYKIETAYYYHGRVINLPCSTSLSSKEIDYVISMVKFFYKK